MTLKRLPAFSPTAGSGEMRVCDNAGSLLTMYRRVWTFQEAYLARQNLCICGGSRVDLIQITRAAAWLLHYWAFIDEPLRVVLGDASDMNWFIDRENGRRRHRDDAPDLLELMIQVRGKGASLDRDKVYGVLGLAPNVQLVADYNKDIVDVYVEAAVATVKDRKGLALLRHVLESTQQQGEVAGSLPSWVPDWRRPWDAGEHPQSLHLDFRAARDKRYDCGLMHDSDNGRAPSRVLRARGFEVGSVAGFTQCFGDRNGMYRDEVWQLIKEALALQASLNLDLTDEQQDAVVAVTLCAEEDRLHNRNLASCAPGFDAFRQLTEQDMDIPSMREITDTSSELQLRATQFWVTLNNVCSLRRFFVTSGGHSGIGPRSMQEDDAVVILHGLRVPALLRKVQDKYIFVGLAYVYGIMDGEALDKHESSGEPDTVFEIT